jgi:hypothetical protein
MTRTLSWLSVVAAVAGCGGTDVSLSDADGAIRVSPMLVDLDAVPVGELVEFELNLDSIEGGDVEVRRVDVVNIEGQFFAGSEEVVLVPSEGSASVVLQYRPLEPGYHYAIATVVSDGTEPLIDVELRAVGVDATANMWPLSIDFGPVPAGLTEDRTVSIANEGVASFAVQEAISTESLFSVVTELPLSVGPGETKSLTVRFSPTTTAATTGSLAIELDAISDTLVVGLRGNDCEGGDPSAYDVDMDGFATCGGDCDDNDDDVRPGATETPDGVDEDCDGTVDEGTTAYDDDGDGYSEDEGDCNDTTPTVAPDNPEVLGNGIDDDCDGVIDSGTVDGDGDGYATVGGDCDDADASVHPGAAEIADGLDNDCDGLVDEGTEAYDDDGDGYTEAAGDCDDTNPATRPGAPEVANYVDDDCDGVVDEGTVNVDDDGDGFSEIGGDCDDANPAVSPAELEVLGDGIDNDCDGVPE